MNMAVHGLTGVIKSDDEANSFYHDAHNLEGKCNYVMTNPPFIRLSLFGYQSFCYDADSDKSVD